MNRSVFLGIGLLLCGVSMAQDAVTAPPVTTGKLLEFGGEITRIEMSPAQGTPSLEVASAGTIHKVQLGSLRYLMQQNFNPKAGGEVKVKGYSYQDHVVAISVTLTDENKTLRLRDDDGWPLWQGERKGRRGAGRGRGRGQQGQQP